MAPSGGRRRQRRGGGVEYSRSAVRGQVSGVGAGWESSTVGQVLEYFLHSDSSTGTSMYAPSCMRKVPK